MFRNPGDGRPPTDGTAQGLHPIRQPEITENLQPGAAYQLAIGSRLQNGRYVVEGSIGQGGMGNVYKVLDTHFSGPNASRALKEMIFRLSDPHAGFINFQREANILVGLRHRGIPTIYDIFVQHDRAYLVLDFIDGENLEKVLAGAGIPLAQDVVAVWMLQLCEIVEYLHSLNTPIVFRDLKPSNVILTPLQEIVLVDFGIAKYFSGMVTQTNVGTNGYAAPEQYRGQAEPRSDIYSLGAMMHHLLTNTDPRREAPFSFDKRPVRSYNSQVSAEMEAVVNRCLQQAPDDRYQSAYELRAAIEDALNGNGSMQTGLTPMARGARAGAARAGAPATIGSRAPRLKWRFGTEQEIWATPLVTDELVYIGSYDNNLYALDIATGTWRWQFATEGGICGKPAIWGDLIIIGSEDFNVYALNRHTGEEVWRNRTWSHVRSSPRIYEDRLFIGSDDGHMHAIDPRTGRTLWRFKTYREVQSSAAYANGVIFFGSCDENFYAVDAVTGERRWTFRTRREVLSSPTIVEDYIYFGSMDCSVYCLEAKSGWQAWSERTDKHVVSSPCVVGDRLYIGSVDRSLYCFNRKSGTVVWTYKTGNQVNSSPVHADGMIFVGSIDKSVYALDAAKGQVRWRFETQDMVPGSGTVRNGVLYIGSTDGWLYALDINA